MGGSSTWEMANHHGPTERREQEPSTPSIEQAFAKLKALLRGAEARTKEALWTTIGQLLDRFKPAECRNYLTNSGYEFT